MFFSPLLFFWLPLLCFYYCQLDYDYLSSSQLISHALGDIAIYCYLSY